MFQTQLIQQVVEWERRLEIEDERRENHRGEPYANYLAQVCPIRNERKSMLARILGLGRGRKAARPAECCYAQEPHCKTQLA
jgi:hypothetical protein